MLGLVGTNGIGKSTALKILAGKQKPNLGQFLNPPDWTEILAYFCGSELQKYFTMILEDDLKAVIKPQYVDQIPKAVKGNLFPHPSFFHHSQLFGTLCCMAIFYVEKL